MADKGAYGTEPKIAAEESMQQVGPMPVCDDLGLQQLQGPGLQQTMSLSSPLPSLVWVQGRHASLGHHCWPAAAAWVTPGKISAATREGMMLAGCVLRDREPLQILKE
jgi:hypothetical protein